MSKSLGSYIAIGVVVVAVLIGSTVFILNRNATTSSNVSSASQSAQKSSQTTQSQTGSGQSQSNLPTSSATAASTGEVILNATTIAQFNGKDGAKCYVAVDGVVYDMTNNPYWQNGTHQPSGGRATCGIDGSTLITQSPHGKDVLSEVSKVGTYLR